MGAGLAQSQDWSGVEQVQSSDPMDRMSKKTLWAGPAQQRLSLLPPPPVCFWAGGSKTSFQNLRCLWSETMGHSEWPRWWGGTFYVPLSLITQSA